MDLLVQTLLITLVAAFGFAHDGAVSYTPLDVYKRQASWSDSAAGIVSYHHLYHSFL